MIKVFKKFNFTWAEFSGSLGDLGLFIPLIVGMTVTAGFILVINTLVGFLAGVVVAGVFWLLKMKYPFREYIPLMHKFKHNSYIEKIYT